MINIKLVRSISFLLTFLTVTGARADIASDVQAGTLTLQQIARNALNNLSPAEVVTRNRQRHDAAGTLLSPAQVVTRMIAAGVNPILAAEAVAQVSPPAAAASIAAAAAAVPGAAADIAAAVARIRPQQAVAIALAVERRVPAMAPQIAALVAQAVPAQAVDVAVAVAEAAPAQANQIADSVANAVPQAAANVHLAVNAAAAGMQTGGTPSTYTPTSAGVGSGWLSDCDPTVNTTPRLTRIDPIVTNTYERPDAFVCVGNDIMRKVALVDTYQARDKKQTCVENIYGGRWTDNGIVPHGPPVDLVRQYILAPIRTCNEPTPVCVEQPPAAGCVCPSPKVIVNGACVDP